MRLTTMKLLVLVVAICATSAFACSSSGSSDTTTRATTTLEPTTEEPTTPEQTTHDATTSVQTTIAPTTHEPTTSEATTAKPTSARSTSKATTPSQPTPKPTQKDELYNFLNGIQQFMTGQDHYVDDRLYNDLTACIKKVDANLYTSVNAQWTGLKGYAQTHGHQPMDNWYPSDSDTKPHQTWSERNCTVQKYGNIPIWEPCNYASNLAYYHTVVEQCAKKTWNMPKDSVNTIIKAYASLGAGSSFMHMSETTTGGISDVRVNDLIGYVAFVEVMKALKPEGSILHELSNTTRAKSVDTIVDEFMMMYINDPV